MALIKIKQVENLQGDLNTLTAADSSIVVDLTNGDASVLTAADSLDDIVRDEFSVADSSIVAGITSDADSLDDIVRDEFSVADSSVLVAAGSLADAAEADAITAADSLDDIVRDEFSTADSSVLVAANNYTDQVAAEYAIDEFGTGATALSGTPGTLNLTGAGGSIGTLEVTDPVQGQFVLDLSVAIEGTNAAEAEQNIIGMYINGLRIEASSINVVSRTAVEVDLPYAIDGNDVFEIKYNKVG